MMQINGRYHLHNKIGQGGMGIVHRATDRLTGETVALKQVFLPVEQLIFNSRPASHTSRELRLALAHEFQTLAGLRHPNIISVLDYGFDEKQQPFFTMSYLEGAKTIVAAARAGRSLPQKINLLIQTLEALAYLHRRSILHRDLKPDNVLVVGDTVRVLDFGLAAAKGQATDSVGSWLYMAPELLLEQPASEASDLYAVGVLAYQLFANQHPFDIYAADVIGEILSEEPDWELLGAAAELTAVIQQLLAKQPTDRPASAAATIAALNQALGQLLPEETTAVQESYLQAATFVGRQQEMTQLTNALSNATTGQGSIWFIGGESGVGKTRLLNELRIQALVSGYLVLHGSGIREGGLPYQLWHEALRLLLLTTPNIDPLTASILSPLIPNSENLLGYKVTPPPQVDSDAQQQRLHEAIAHLIAQQTQPVLLLLEDLQWAHVSLLPLSVVARHITSKQLVIVGNYRNDEPHTQLNQLFDQLPQAHHLTLARLSAVDMAALSQAMLGEAGQSEQVLTLLQRETEGNAFFAVEVVRALAREAGRLGNVGQQALPAHVFTAQMQQILRQRLQRLAPLHQPLLELAAVAGRQPDLRLLAQLWPEANLDTWLTAVHETAVFTIDNNRWQFAHDKLREAILTNLPPNKLTQHHTTIATTLEQLYPNQPDQAAILAHHWQHAGNTNREQTYRYQAGRHASQQYAHQDALSHLNRAIMLAPNDEAAYEALQLHERTLELLGRETERKTDLQQLTDLAQRIARPEAKAYVARRQAERAERQGDYSLCLQYAQQTIAEAEKANNTEEIAAGYALWGNALLRQGNYAIAQQKIQQGLTLYQQLDYPIGVGKSYISLGLITYYQSQHTLAEQYFHNALTCYQKAESLAGMVRAYNSLGVAAYTRGHYDRAQIQYEQAFATAQQLGSQREQIPILSNLGVVTYILGLFATSKQYYEQALATARDVGERRSQILALNNLGRLHFTQQQLAPAVDYLQEAYKLAQETQDHWGEGAVLNNLGHVYALLKRYDRARSYYEKALAIHQQANQQAGRIKATLGLLHIGLQQGSDITTLLAQMFTLMEQNPAFTGSEHVMELYLLFYRCLVLLQDERQTAVLTQAHHLLQQRADQLQNVDQRRSFLQNVPEHREIIQLFAARLG